MASGLASGLMTTAHELGGAFGVAIFSAVALAATSLSDGYGDAALGGTLMAVILALIAGAAIPSFRPRTAEQAALH